MDSGWRKNYSRYKSFFLNMMTQYKERSDVKAYLEILMSLVTVSIFSIFALRPTILTIAELIQQIEEKKETIAKMDSKIQDLGKAQTLYDRQRSNINLLTETAIPKNLKPDILARQMEGLTSKNQSTFTNFSFGNATILGTTSPKADNKEDKNPNSILTDTGKMSFTFSSQQTIDNYQVLLNTLRDFEILRSPPNIKTIELSLKEDKDETPGLVLSINGEMIYITDNEK